VTSPPALDLEPFGREDFGRLLSWAPDADALLQWSGSIFTWPLDGAQLEAYLAPALLPEPTRLIWRARERAGARAVVGHAELNEVEREHGAAALARVIVDPKRRGEGLGTAMVRRVLAVAFDELGLHRVELRVFDFNTPAIAAYERLGFALEGRRRETRRVNGAYWSSLWYSMLEDEWRGREDPEREES
jgi:RimJ/RimL family protein N-acetyltransferase